MTARQTINGCIRRATITALIFICAAQTSTTHAISVTPTGILPNGTFVNDYSGDIGEFGVAEFEILWSNIEALTLTIHFDQNDIQAHGNQIALRISNVNNTAIPWSQLYIRIDDVIQDDPSDDPLWAASHPVNVMAQTPGLPYQAVANMNSLKQIELAFDPLVESADSTNPNGDVTIGAFAGQDLDDWFVDITPLFLSEKNEFNLTLSPASPIPTPSAAAIFTLISVATLLMRRPKRHDSHPTSASI